MIVTFLMVSTSSITMQSLGKIVQRAPAVGSKIWCLSLCFFCLSHSEAGALFVRGDRVWATIVSRFMGRFRCSFQLFSEVIAFSEELDSLHFCCEMAPQFWRNCGQELRKVQKSAEKFVHYMALVAIAKVHVGSPEMARKEQVCAHQKSYSV